MAFGSCFSCFKYSVFLFNFLLWLLGCTLLAVGAWLLMDDNAGRYVDQFTSASPDPNDPPVIISYEQVTDSSLTPTLAYLFIAFGLVIIFVAFIGCCGAVRENQCMLGAFLISLMVLFAVLLGIGIWALVARKDVDAHTIQLQQLTNRMVKDGVRNYFTDKEHREFMDRLQTKFRCCGAENAGGDYLRRGSTQQPPCNVAYQRRSCIPVYFNYVGNHFEDFMRDRLTIVGAVAIAIAVAMLTGMAGVLLLGCALKERRWNTNP